MLYTQIGLEAFDKNCTVAMQSLEDGIAAGLALRCAATSIFMVHHSVHTMANSATSQVLPIAGAVPGSQAVTCALSLVLMVTGCLLRGAEVPLNAVAIVTEWLVANPQLLRHGGRALEFMAIGLRDFMQGVTSEEPPAEGEEEPVEDREEGGEEGGEAGATEAHLRDGAEEKKEMSYEERQEAYRCARERIFSSSEGDAASHESSGQRSSYSLPEDRDLLAFLPVDGIVRDRARLELEDDDARADQIRLHRLRVAIQVLERHVPALRAEAGMDGAGQHQEGEPGHAGRGVLHGVAWQPKEPEPEAPKAEPVLIVLDAPNIAMRHGKKKVFSCIGVQLAIEYWQERGHKVVGFIPDYYVDYENVAQKRRTVRAGFEVETQKLPDDVTLLNRLLDEGSLIATPPQDYDDSYSIKYAENHGGCVVTNDRYKDHVEKGTSGDDKRARRDWVRTHCISYTFVNDEFVPNPDFKLPKF